MSMGFIVFMNISITCELISTSTKSEVKQTHLIAELDSPEEFANINLGTSSNPLPPLLQYSNLGTFSDPLPLLLQSTKEFTTVELPERNLIQLIWSVAQQLLHVHGIHNVHEHFNHL